MIEMGVRKEVVGDRVGWWKEVEVRTKGGGRWCSTIDGGVRYRM